LPCSKLVLGKYFGKVAVRICRQLIWWSHLDDAAVTQDNNYITVADCAESVGNDNDGAVDKLSLDNVVDDAIGLDVDGRCRFVHHQYATSPEQRACQTEQLLLADAETVSRIRNHGVELLRQTPNELRQLRNLQHAPDLGVGDRVSRIQVEPDAAAEQDRILRDDGQAGTESAQRNAGNVDAIKEDLPRTDANG